MLQGEYSDFPMDLRLRVRGSEISLIEGIKEKSLIMNQRWEIGLDLKQNLYQEEHIQLLIIRHH